MRVARPRWVAAALALAVAVAVAFLSRQVDWMRQADRALLGWLAGESGRVVGEGTEEDPWAIEYRGAVPGEVAPLRVLFLDDDPEGYFEQVPPPPSDLMVLLARLREAGVGQVSFGYPLQWERPDTLALEAMRGELDRQGRSVLGFVVKDSTSPVPVPPPLLAASMPYAAVEGDGAKLPVVNGVVGMAPEFGGGESWAGFTRIETEEPEEARAYLMARWSDRVIFALPVVMEIARRGLSPEADLRVRMGREIALGENGARIPIDFRGRVRLPDQGTERVAVPATAAISREWPRGFWEGNGPVYLTDERLLGDKADLRWAEQMPRLDAAVRRVPVVTGRRIVPGWPLAAVVIFATVLAVGGAWLVGGGRLRWRIGMSLALGLALSGVLGAMVRGGIGAPMPLAMLSVPMVLAVAVLFLDLVPTAEVVRAGEARASTPPKPGVQGEKKMPRRKRKPR